MPSPSHLRPEVLARLASLQTPTDAESLWTAFSGLLQEAFSPLNDILFASPLLGFHPVFARTLSNYPRGEGYWARLVEIAGVTDVMTLCPGLPVARMSDHFDRSRERDERMYQEFMKPEGWAHCANIFFWSAEGLPLGTLGMNRTAGQGDFGDEDMALALLLQPHLQAALHRVIHLSRQDIALMAFRQSLNTLPLPFVTLDDKLQVTFENQPGKEALHRWQTGGREARVWKTGDGIPEDLAVAGNELLQIWREKVQSDTFCGEEILVEKTHPTDKGFTVALRIVLPPGESSAPGLILTFQNPAASHHATARALQLLGALTQGEREVARLAAAGHQNEDIAVELGLSVHTVRAHLRKVFAKLEIDSRSRLAPLFQSLE